MNAPFPGTARQMGLLRFIRGFQIAKGGISPTLEEMAAGIGLNAKSGISRLLDGLEERGHIRRLPNRTRAVEVLTPIPVPACPDGHPLYFIPFDQEAAA